MNTSVHTYQLKCIFWMHVLHRTLHTTLAFTHYGMALLFHPEKRCYEPRSEQSRDALKYRVCAIVREERLREEQCDQPDILALIAHKLTLHYRYLPITHSHLGAFIKYLIATHAFPSPDVPVLLTGDGTCNDLDALDREVAPTT